MVKTLPPVPSRPNVPATTSPPPQAIRADVTVGLTARTISVGGNETLPAAAFTGATAPFVGRRLSADDLRALARAVADVARRQGYLFATASIEAQPVADGTLRVTLDEGRIDAVRTLGPRNAVVDRLLATLVSPRPASQPAVERALLLVGDVPGVRVESSRYVREDGFGILFVTIAQDRAFGYVQVDNRGSDEVGPIRSTTLLNVRGVLTDGDEIGLIGLQTPAQPREFAFIGGRYTLPVDSRGGTLSLSGSYGRSHPGAELRAFDVIGHSTDAAIALARPLVRSRSHSLWVDAAVRWLKVDQSLRAIPLRNDEVTSLTVGLNGNSRLAGGVLRGDLDIVAGLPLPGVTHEGDRLTSRADGDARFVLGVLSLDWTRPIVGPLSLRLASTGQLASRPLLASLEIGAGGPSFGRAYDYSERTGDRGILGSAEVRLDVAGKGDSFLSRMQIFGFVDGGYVDNLRRGTGGGSLISAGGGVRIGRGVVDGGVEIAVPLNSDRFDTADRRPRISTRLSARF
ncbi:ShlB/FhaC/HecB family hemolysin secretion/activation protein [Sphingomonas solaris]|uniref:ShlB/FhaC/HecB family hemolysin secretion/activation protein n=1 Tax=Alterirhizorhabdus solaris TaxID=2529389 RepID=UPI001EF03DB2|nr:ShlB/FhaC/HecB family hemolysin secretion/activation protein [Sphingomonas solaris]